MIHDVRQIYQVIRKDLLKGASSQLREHRDRLAQEGLSWRYDGLGDWSTESIFNKLRELGVDTDAERFEQQARDAGRCRALDNQWGDGLQLDGFWDDFPFLAAEELWKRLTPHLLCPEIVAARLESAIERTYSKEDEAENSRFTMEATALLMDYLEAFAEHERESAFDEVTHCAAYDFGDWLVDIAADYGDQYLEHARRIARVMSPTVYADNLCCDLALSLVRADRWTEALEVVKANLERWPDDLWVRIKSGDIYSATNAPETAADCYRTALRWATEPYSWDGVAERLEPLLEQLGRGAEWTRLERRFPRPEVEPVLPIGSPAAPPAGARHPIGVITHDPVPQITIVPGPAGAQRGPAKIGRNDPCPCGSGKKYKKCCVAQA